MKALRGLLAVFSLEGLAAFLVTLLTPSESGRAVFLWLSPERILLAGLVLVVWGGFLALCLITWLSTPKLEWISRRLDDWCLTQQHLGGTLIFLLVTPLLLAAGALAVVFTPLSYPAYRSWAPDTFPLLHSVVAGLLPLLLFVIVVWLEVGAFLAWRYGEAVRARETWTWDRLRPFVLLLLIGPLTIFQWIVLAFQLRTFVNLPPWYWKIQVVPISWHDLLLVVPVLLGLALICWIISTQRGTVAPLLLTCGLAWFLQIGVGVMTGRGQATLTDRYFSTYHKTYIQQASQNELSIPDEIRQYETAFSIHSFTSTKPPGLMAFYIGLDQIVNGYPSTYSMDQRYARLSAVVETGFPVLAAALALLIFAFARSQLEVGAGWVALAAPLLYAVAPNATLFSLFADQAIYPLVFLLAAWFIVVAIRRGSLVLAFLVGVLLYLATFFAFTMLPLYPFAGIYLLFDHWRNRGERHWSQPIAMIVAIAAGTLLIHGLFVVFLNYNFLPRFEKTVLINHNFDFYLRVGLKPPTAAESIPTRIVQALNAAWFNNLDFAAAVGFPIYVLFAARGIRLLKRLFTGAVAASEIVLGSLFLSYIVLSLAGTAQGEVPRLWLFWLPMVVVLAALEFRRWAERRPLLLYGLVVAEFITYFLTFHFQDLRM